MFTKSRLTGPAFVAAGLALIAVMLGASRVGASSSINAINPGGGSPPVYHQAAPRLEPPDSALYVSHTAGAPITAPDGRPVAQLGTIPATVQTVSVNLPTPHTPPPPSTRVAYQILASVRYIGSEHSVLVTTTRPTAAAAQQPTVFGDYTELANGTTAWVRINMPYKEPNQVVFMHNGLIITIASDLPVEDIKALAAQVVLR